MKINKMNKNSITKGLRVKSTFSGTKGIVTMVPHETSNCILIKWDNGNDTYAPFTKLTNVVTD